MPIYEYHCDHCHTGETRIVGMAQADIQYCPRCGKALTLLISRPAPFPVGTYGKAGGIQKEKQ